MKNNHYQIFVNQARTLAETIVIKSPEAATSLNKFVRERLGSNAVNDYDPTSWKYYMNLAGEYHPIDQLMTVVSLDTREKISFSKESLLVHRATARGYAYGTRLYKELVSQYPNQESLILGILYPVDIDRAIAAEDGTILGFPDGLVEVNEYSLIPKLQSWINGFIARWVNRQFNYTDSLYTAAWLGVMYINLVPAILTFRLEACKTNEAHSFHVRQYLASHGIDESYTEMLTLKQSLWLYRNINHLERNLGTQENFDWLVENLMTERGLPIAEYTMRHDVTPMPEALYPELKFRKKTLNLKTGDESLDTVTLGQMLDKEDGLARSNPKVKAEVEPVIQEAMENSGSNVMLTKLLESSMVDRTNSTPYTLDDILMNHWLSLASSNLYQAYINVPDPKTGERIPLTVKDAFVFVWYAFCQSNGIDLIDQNVPKMFAQRVQRNRLPSINELMSIVDSNLVSRKTAEQALSGMSDIGVLISTEAFYNRCQEIYVAANKQRQLIALQEHSVARGLVHGMVSRIYSDQYCSLTDGDIRFDAWFRERSIDIDGYSLADLGLLYVNIVREATGLALNTTKSLKDLQAAMLRILSTLSSYSIQLNADINTSNSMMTDWVAVRVGDVRVKTHGSAYVPNAVTVQDIQVKTKDVIKGKITPTIENEVVNAKTHMDPIRIENGVKIRFDGRGIVTEYRVNTAPVRISVYPPLQPNDQNVVPVIGIDHWLTLPDKDKYDFTDEYGNVFTPIPPEGPEESDLIPLSFALPINVLNGLFYDNTWPPAMIYIDRMTRRRYLNGFDKS